MPECVLAADVGGTNIRVALVDANGKILKREESDTPNRATAEEICSFIAGIANKILHESENIGSVQKFGFALPAIIDYSTSSVVQSPNLPHLDGFGIGQYMAKHTGLDVKLENDATAATIGEHWLGGAKGANDVLCVTLGTGVGGGLIIQGNVVRGPDGTAGEVGHICVEPDGPLCGCGSHGCVEQFASATGIVRRANERLPGAPFSPLSRLQHFTASDVFDAAKAGDRLSIEVLEAAGYYLGIVLAGLINTLNPEVIVITGGVSGAWEMFIGRTLEEVKKRAFQRPAERAKIVRGQLGDDAGILGAAKRVLAHADKGSS
jgi:glucokinase